LVIGYGYSEKFGTNYFIIKNSWGHDWGLGGYMMLEAGDGKIYMMPSYPVVEEPICGPNTPNPSCSSYASAYRSVSSSE
jgi:hypothetical protein